MSAAAVAPSFTLELDHGVLVIELLVDAITREQFLERLQESVVARIPEADQVILIDCQQLTGRVTSQFFATLIAIRHKAAAEGVLICLCHVSNTLYEAYKITCLERIIPLYKNRSAALMAVGNFSRAEQRAHAISRIQEEEEQRANMTSSEQFSEKVNDVVGSLRNSWQDASVRTRKIAVAVGLVVVVGIIAVIIQQVFVTDSSFPPKREAPKTIDFPVGKLETPFFDDFISHI
mgnify:CR=1 FL=1